MASAKAVVIGLSLGIAAMGPLRADAGDAESGHALARQWCSSCHLVEPGTSGGDQAPPFESIANDPTRTPARLRGWLASPHPPMPDLKLSRTQIDDVMAYLESLKRK
ncbi:MAG: cytochrome c [Alphaproteobacteria bacterium]